MPKREPAMTRMEFRDALDMLGWTPYRAAKPMGISIRHAHRYANGDSPIPGPIAILVRGMVDKAKRKME